ncbi:MAG: hypothetical protein O2887_00135 [Bacteroidetes bacterium]|nr:hypothetical protein [Bacteroidota bacterium]MDA1118897.1 hypothetical protein [Bacteroidota bacterium]
MKPLYSLFVLFELIPALLFAQYSTNDIEYYVDLNDREMRLADYKDSREMLLLKLAQLEVVNKSRKQYKAPPVQLDILASRIANKQCKEAAEQGFRGHWNTRGEKPYQRYAFGGGTDHVTENASATWMEGGSFDRSPQSFAKLMVNLHGQFMAEIAPNDGHKQTVIDKYHNFVGLGCHMTAAEFRYYEEFIDRYAVTGPVPAKVRSGEEFTVEVTPAPGYFLYYAVAYYEKPPKAMAVAQVNRQSSYPDYTDETTLQYAPWDIIGYRTEGGKYNIPFKFDKKGSYYIQTMVDKKNPAGTTSFSTVGKIVATGIVVIVE